LTTAASLLNTPNDAGSWDIYAFTLSQNIADIQQAILTQKGVNSPQYPLYPIPQVDITEWLQRVSQSLGDITSELNINSTDVENVNLDDERERQAWSNAVYVQVNQARIILRI
jgi:hypothetical protein